MDKASSLCGWIDCVFLNAGVSMHGALDQFDPDDDNIFRTIMEINFWGVVTCTQYALPYLKKSPSGRIGVVSSFQGLVGVPNRTIYSASKFALHGLFNSLRMELRNTPIKITLFCPGYVATNLNNSRLTLNDKPEDDNQKKAMPAEVCAEIMFKALERGEEICVTHTNHYVFSFLLSILPMSIIDFIVLKGSKSNKTGENHTK